VIYSLLDISDLENDLEFILNRIEEMYSVRIEKDTIYLYSLMDDKSNANFISVESSVEFNKLIPRYKSLHKDMYAFIESISRLGDKKFDYKHFESIYENFKYFRLLNNMFKHPEEKNMEILFTKVFNINQNTFDLLCCFRNPNSFKNLMYASFIILFIQILRDLNVIEIKV
jgi:hypothetical protein